MKCVHLSLMSLALLALAACASAPSQAPAPDPEHDAVLSTVRAFFDTMAAKDVEGARRLLIEEGRFHIVRAVDGNPSMRSFTNADFLRELPAMTASLRERMWEPQVRVHGPIATFWARYDFWIDGKLSHCGVDAFDLVKTADGWKIAGGVYTTELEGCEASPLGPLSE